MTTVIVGLEVFLSIELREPLGSRLSEKKDKVAVSALTGGKLQTGILVEKGFGEYPGVVTEKTAVQGTRRQSLRRRAIHWRDRRRYRGGWLSILAQKRSPWRISNGTDATGPATISRVY